MTMVWSMEMTPRDKLVMLALADNASDEGFCWPSIGTIRAKTCLSERSVQNAMVHLRNRGLVKVKAKVGHSNTYTLCENELAALAGKRRAEKPVYNSVDMLRCRGALAAPTPAAPAPQGVQGVHPESSSESPYNHSKSKNPLKTVSREQSMRLSSNLPGFSRLVDKLKS
jgi:hypothetical protein